MKLYIGNQNYSSWSLRAWIIFEQCDIQVDVVKLKLFTPEFYQALEHINPAAKVPTLVDNDITIWDSLAILEYINETQLNNTAWPNEMSDRAKARALACEMHSGFPALRNEMPMNCRAIRNVVLSEHAKNDIARIDQMWAEQMNQYPDGWLFNEWSIADAMFAPIALRFMTYQIKLSAQAQRYQDKVCNSPAIKTWLSQASQEVDIVKEDEAGEPV